MPTDRAAGQDRRLAGRYRLGRVLGVGGGGIVREGEDTLLRRRVAIKEVRLPPLASDAERSVFGERVLREARAAARLHHPCLVTVYDVIDADEHPWIVMEYVDGTSLADLIRESGRLSPLRVARIGISLADALEAAHRAGVIHRDVKPGNVLVTDDGQLRLTDFGIAVIEGDARLTSSGMLIGSPAYTAPERARGARAGAPGDVWGLGATLFAAVEGDAPYVGEGPIATLAAVVENRRQPFRYAGPLRGVLTELMESNPARRPSLAETRRRLRKIAESIEEETPDVSPTVAMVGEAPADDDEGGNEAQAPPRLAAPVRRMGGPGRVAQAARPETDVAAARGDEHVRRADSAMDAGLDVLTGRDAGDAGPDGAGSGRGVGDSAGAAGYRGGRRSRTVLFGVVIALLVAVAVTLSLVLAPGSPPSQPSADSTATTPPEPTPTSAPSPSARPSATSSAGSGATGTSNLGALVPTTTTPAVAPARFASRRGPSGWSVAVPANWTIKASGNGRQTFTAPSGYPNLLIETQEKAGPSAIAAWRSLEPDVRAKSPGYRLLSIRAADGGDGTNAAIYEFTVTSGGRTVRALDFGVVRNGHGYALLWRVPENQWQDELSLMRTIFATFRPGP
jgi:tRNA A-37 threonylcarbamoyl transferase component Bud32